MVEGLATCNHPFFCSNVAEWDFSVQPTVLIVFQLKDGTRALEAVDNVTLAFQWSPQFWNVAGFSMNLG